MTIKDVTAEFRCRACKSDNRQTVTIDTDDDLRGLNMRRKRAVDVDCGICGVANSVEVDD